ncbi:MAG: DUF3822 family protein [Bacteroidales bacterium]
MADQFTVVNNKLDESFNLQETRNYGLSILFNESNFAYCILDFKRNKYLGVLHLLRNEVKPQHALPMVKPPFDEFLKGVIHAMPWLKNPYKSIKVAYEGRKCTLIPAQLFDSAEKENYLKLSFPKQEEEQTFSDHLMPLDSHQVFSIPVSMLNAVRGQYPNIKIVHFSSVLIESIWINYKNRINSNRVFIHIREKLFDLMIFDGRQMSYFNTFPFQNSEDVVYYLIFVLEQLNLNPEHIPLVLLGNVEKGSGLFELLAKYVRHVEFGRRNESFKYSYILNQLSPQAYYPLLNFFSCGL